MPFVDADAKSAAFSLEEFLVYPLRILGSVRGLALRLCRKDGRRIGQVCMMKPLKEISAKTRRQYAPTFKLEAVRNWLGSGKSTEVVSKELGLSPGRLFAWRKLLAPAAAGGKAAAGARTAPLSDLQSLLDASERTEIFDYIEVSYDRERIHTAIGALSPTPCSRTRHPVFKPLALPGVLTAAHKPRRARRISPGKAGPSWEICAERDGVNA